MTQQQDAGRSGDSDRPSRPMYTRTMPGGGMVRVELIVRTPGGVADERARGRVVIDGAGAASTDTVQGAPVVVEELESDDADQMVGELCRIARDNAAIARRMIRRRSSSVQRAD